MGNQAGALKEFFGVATQIRRILRASHVSDPVVDDVLDRVMGAIDRAYCCSCGAGITDEAKHSLIDLIMKFHPKPVEFDDLSKVVELAWSQWVCCRSDEDC